MSPRKKIKMRPPTEANRACVSPKSSLFFSEADCAWVYTPNPDFTSFSHPLVVRYIYA